MGGTKHYLESGGFSEATFEQVGTTVNGIKIIEPIDKSKRNSTPMFSNTPGAIYAKADKKNEPVNQITYYGNIHNRRAKAKDIDIGHSHVIKNKRGKTVKRVKEDEVHVHYYRYNAKTGNYDRINRKASAKERRTLMIARNKRNKK